MNETHQEPPYASKLCRQVRGLACALRDKTAATPFAADSLVLANEVGSLCDYVEQLHGNVETLLMRIESEGKPHPHARQTEPSAVDQKAMEIQREIHELHPTLEDAVKALFMWRDSPEQRLRDGK